MYMHAFPRNVEALSSYPQMLTTVCIDSQLISLLTTSFNIVLKYYHENHKIIMG